MAALESRDLRAERPALARAAQALFTTTYAVVGLGLRLLMARDFFLSGQPKIAGPVITIPLPGHGAFAVTLPAEIRPATFELFARDYSGLPISSTLAAYLVSYAEFALPICLLLGFATRLSALVLMTITVATVIYVSAAALWTTQVYLVAILAVLVVVGPGAVSADALIRGADRP